jgi:hypothetical protein
VFVNDTGDALGYETFVRIPAGPDPIHVTQNGQTVAYIHDTVLGKVRVTGSLGVGAGAVTTVHVQLRQAGDLNCDGAVDFKDINPFVAALTGQASYYAAFPECNWYNADCNGDGQVDFKDINPFVGLLSGA